VGSGEVTTAAATGRVDDGAVGAVGGVWAELGATDSDVRMIVEARPPRRDITGSMGRVPVVDALEDGADAALLPSEAIAPLEILVVFGGATNEPPERNVLRNCGLAAAKVVRGWAVVALVAGS